MVDFQVSGLEELLAGLGALDHKGIQNLATASLKRSSAGLVRAVRREAPVGPSPHVSSAKGKRGSKGPLSRNVTARKLRTRQGELVAISVGPRAWYKHFVIRGTRPHIIEARDAGGVRAESADIRRINRYEAGGYTSDRANSRHALRLARAAQGRFVSRVRHPGARGNDFVSRAARGQAGPLRMALARDIEARFAAKVAA